ncbi:bifunctional riboflavin kinase/FAD synthetase [bacterium]|nr:bifunctional riboflavin kinase/FAD synthetase [bacterium]
MQIYTELNKNPNLSLALGFFDGVHLGHKSVIENAVDFAKQNNTRSAVITFKDHPCCFLKGISPKYILTRKERQEKFEELGIDFLYELDFESIAGLTAEDYLKRVLVNNFMPSAIFTGWNHNFGYKKSGDTKFLRENSKKFGYEYFELPPQKCEGEIISSTAIRKYLQAGKIEKANQMLGFNFSITGKVVEGNKIGRTIGFKTANIEYPYELINIPYGVYSVITNYGKAISNYGLRPTINGSKPVLEVHILDFDKDIYGKTIKVGFLRMLRPERKFNSLDELKEQIKQDISKI